MLSSLVLPKKAAWMACVGAIGIDAVHAATPDVTVTAVHSVVAPSLKVTVPEGIPAPTDVACTVAVKSTLWPGSDGLALDVSVTEVAAGWILSDSCADVRGTEPCAALERRRHLVRGCGKRVAPIEQRTGVCDDRHCAQRRAPGLDRRGFPDALALPVGTIFPCYDG